MAEPAYKLQELDHIHIRVKRVVLGKVTYGSPRLHGLPGNIEAIHGYTAGSSFYVAGEYFHRSGFPGAVWP